MEQLNFSKRRLPQCIEPYEGEGYGYGYNSYDMEARRVRGQLLQRFQDITQPERLRPFSWGVPPAFGMNHWVSRELLQDIPDTHYLWGTAGAFERLRQEFAVSAKAFRDLNGQLWGHISSSSGVFQLPGPKLKGCKKPVKTPQQVTQQIFDKANQLANRHNKGEQVFPELVSRYADLLEVLAQGHITHEDPRWEILNRKLSLDDRTRLKLAAKRVHKEDIVRQTIRATDVTWENATEQRSESFLEKLQSKLKEREVPSEAP